MSIQNINTSVSDSTRWWVYLANYGGLNGSTRVDMGLRKIAPDRKLPWVVLIGTTYRSSRADKLPESDELDRLNRISDPLILSVMALGPAIYAGTFTHDLEQLHFIYVANTSGTEVAFKASQSELCSASKPIYIEKHDPEWNQYLNFLYPNQETIDFYGYDSKTNTSTKGIP